MTPVFVMLQRRLSLCYRSVKVYHVTEMIVFIFYPAFLAARSHFVMVIRH
jgi:hypothetical protein